MKMQQLILASASPRRRELLSLYTQDFVVCASDFDEDAVPACPPVELEGQVFGKPDTTEDAVRMIRALSGRTHQVHTGVCVSDGRRTESFVDSCRVTFFPIPEEEIVRYAATREPYDKAGASGLQGHAALWVDRIEGDYYTIMGLPVSRTVRLVEDFAPKNPGER